MLTICSYWKTDFSSVKRHECRCWLTKLSVFAQFTSSENIPIIESQMRANNVDSVLSVVVVKSVKG